MTRLLPTPLLLVAVVAALQPLTFVLRRPVSGLQLIVEAFAVTIAVMALVWQGWVMLWLIEQRW